MTPEEARAHYNFLLTLCIRKAESFGPMAFAFIKDHSFPTVGLTPEEQFNLMMAITDAFADEPKRYAHKLDCLRKALDIFPRTRFYDSVMARQIQQEIQRLTAELEVWFAAAAVSLLIQGAPDLHEYGLQGGAGLLTRTYASDKTAAYAGAGTQPWQRGLSFNFINIHLQLLPDATTAVVPANTPLFSLYPVLARGQYQLEDARSLAPRDPPPS